MLLILIKLLYLVFLDPFLQCFIGMFKRKKELDFTSDIVLVTGAAQGLGKAIAHEFAKRGCVLVLWDINESKLLKTCSELTSQGYEAFAHVVDCSKKQDIYNAAQRLKEEIGNVSVLVNNAGILNDKLIIDLEDEKLLQLFNVNFFSHYWTIKSFLPWMMKNDYGFIVSISSITSFNGTPFISDYCAAKSAVSSLCESLTVELMVAGNSGVTVTCIHPGMIDTGLQDGHEELKQYLQIELPSMSPSYAAGRIMEAVSNRRRSLTIPKYYAILRYLKLLLPEKAQTMLFKESVKGVKVM